MLYDDITMKHSVTNTRTRSLSERELLQLLKDTSRGTALNARSRVTNAALSVSEKVYLDCEKPGTMKEESGERERYENRYIPLNIYILCIYCLL